MNDEDFIKQLRAIQTVVHILGEEQESRVEEYNKSAPKLKNDLPQLIKLQNRVNELNFPRRLLMEIFISKLTLHDKATTLRYAIDRAIEDRKKQLC